MRESAPHPAYSKSTVRRGAGLTRSQCSATRNGGHKGTLLTLRPDRCHVPAQQLGRDPPPRVNDAIDIANERTIGKARTSTRKTFETQPYGRGTYREIVYKPTAWDWRSGREKGPISKDDGARLYNKCIQNDPHSHQINLVDSQHPPHIHTYSLTSSPPSPRI